MTRGNIKHIVVIEDDRTLNALLVRQLRELGHTATGFLSWSEVQPVFADEDPSLVILDIRLPDIDGMEIIPALTEECPVIVLTAFGSIDHAVRAIKSGVADYLTKPVNPEELELAINRVLENVALRRRYQFIKARAQSETSKGMVGSSPALDHVRQLIDVVAPAETTVLIQGESGVGKELVAQAIHRISPRTGNEFVDIDCCTLQETLFESELFGHERGAFTGADRRKRGLIEVAEGGTVFLDEIGEVSPAIQAKLLRILETGHYRRLGGTRDLTSSVRFITATNRNLEEASREGRFRTDLYYRLSGFTITVPPLRERLEDVVPIANFFVDTRTFSKHLPKRLARSALDALATYHWPGNIRELRNVIERAILISGDEPIVRRDDLNLPKSDQDQKSTVELRFDHEPTLEELKKAYLARLVDRYQGHRARIARILGVSERNIYRMLRNRERETRDSIAADADK